MRRLASRAKDGLGWLWLKICDEFWTILISLLLGGLVVAGGHQLKAPPAGPQRPCLTVDDLERMIVAPDEATCNEMCGSGCDRCTLFWACCGR